MVKIVADSTCDLSKELLEEYDITILPLHIICNDADYLDGFSISPEEIFEWSEANKTTPKTSAVAPGEAMDGIRPLVEAGHDVICISISDELSTTGNVMRLTAQMLNEEAGREQVKVINSANLSTGIGLLVVEAAIMAKDGMESYKIVERIEELVSKVRASFVVDTLTYLHRGGRCSGLAAIAGGALKLHPKIVVKNGVLTVDKKYRGSMKHVLIQYTHEMLDLFMNARTERVFITHACCDKVVVDAVHEYVSELGIFDEIIETQAGGVISSHCGPGTLGVLFLEK